jgi:hypothetical protein
VFDDQGKSEIRMLGVFPKGLNLLDAFTDVNDKGKNIYAAVRYKTKNAQNQYDLCRLDKVTVK